MTRSGMAPSRRAVLRQGAATLGAALLMPAATHAVAAGPVPLDFEGWNYDPAFQTAIVDEFNKQFPDIQAKFVAEPADVYIQKIIARFAGNNPPDLLYVRDQTVAGWADAEYIRPINDFPGWEKRLEGLIPFHLSGLQYQGKVWGLPYYGDHIAYIYNKDILQKAGITAPPQTWAQIADQALAIKKAGLLDKPVVFPLKIGGGLHWWSAVYASGGSLFDKAGDPMFPDRDGVALALTEWLVDAARNKGILDVNSVQMGTAETRLALASGKVAFASSARYDLKVINDPKTSKISGQGMQMLFPSLTEAGPHATVGWTQMFSIAKDTRNPDAAWRFLQFISSQDVAKRYYLKDGVGYAYKALDADADIAAETGRWSDQGMFAKQGALAKARESLPLTWATEWEDFNLQKVQQAVLGHISARDAMVASADKARQLKKAG